MFVFCLHFVECEVCSARSILSEACVAQLRGGIEFQRELRRSDMPSTKNCFFDTWSISGSNIELFLTVEAMYCLDEENAITTVPQLWSELKNNRTRIYLYACYLLSRCVLYIMQCV